MRNLFFFLVILFFIAPYFSFSQNAKDSLLSNATITNCIQYALRHQPAVQQSLINEKITDETIKIKLADWFPQLNLNYYLQHNLQLQTAYLSGNYVSSG